MFNYLLAPALLSLLALVLSCVVTHITIPVVIRVAREKHLMDEPNNRSSHTQKTPSLGGIAIFAALSVIFILFSQLTLGQENQAHLFLPSLIILFFIGLKDDILVIDPYKKLIAQLLAGSLLIWFTDIRIGSLFGIFDTYQIPYVVSFIITLFVIVVVVNAYNLIDGIDGLAGGLGIVICITFGIYFYIAGLIWATILCTTLAGSLLSFMKFNFSQTHKIFMGDCGSLVIGFILALLAVKFIQINETQHLAYVGNAPTLAITILSIPLFDTLRLFIQRVVSGRGPFHPDRNHIHHFIIDRGFSHFQASMMLSSINALIVAFSFFVLAQASVVFSFVALMAVFTAYLSIVRRKPTVVVKDTKGKVYISPSIKRKIRRETANQLN